MHWRLIEPEGMADTFTVRLADMTRFIELILKEILKYLAAFPAITLEDRLIYVLIRGKTMVV